MKQLTKEQMYQLFQIALGVYYNKQYKYIEDFGVNFIQVEDSGHRLHHFKIIQNDVDVRFGDVYDFKYYTTDLRSDDKKEHSVKNHKLLHERLYEYGFYNSSI